MKSLWDDKDAKQYATDLDMRVYTSRLLGQDSNLVLHGGGNTSVKTSMTDLFGEAQDVLCVKGSGWDLATIEAQGFAPVRMDTLLKMAELKNLTDTQMVKNQRAAMLDPYAPNPSVEAILHAIIPFKFVDHTHADAVVTITNTPNGEDRIKEVYGDRVLYIPYVMPGFILAKTVYELTKDVDWSKYEGMVLLNHGIFTFDDDAKKSYENMIRLVDEAEQYLANQGALEALKESKNKDLDLLKLSQLRKCISQKRGGAVLAQASTDLKDVYFASQDNAKDYATRGCLTPDHVIRTKRIPIVVSDNLSDAVNHFDQDYQKYFNQYAKQETMLDTAPRWGVWPGVGRMAFGRSVKENKIILDITAHTRDAILMAEHLGGWQALDAKDIFEVEYWELEQAKLKKMQAPLEFQGKVAIVTGAASGIGKACVNQLVEQGACVVACDINPVINELQLDAVLALELDLTDTSSVSDAIKKGIAQFGGIDLLVSNAGILPDTQTLDQMDEDSWQKSVDVNLTAHQKLLKEATPFLKEGIDPAIVIIASKNVPAPGAGNGAYSVAKAGLTQLARIAALELGQYGIRVNVVHPNQVFDTAIWSDEIIEKRAQSYGVSVEEYKTSNVLHTTITSDDVAINVAQLLGKGFSKTTGAQIPIDGGNTRVI